MNVTCPNCATVYRVDPAKVPAGGVRARCAVCSAVFAVGREPRRGGARRVAAAAPRAGATAAAGPLRGIGPGTGGACGPRRRPPPPPAAAPPPAAPSAGRRAAMPPRPVIASPAGGRTGRRRRGRRRRRRAQQPAGAAPPRRRTPAAATAAAACRRAAPRPGARARPIRSSPRIPSLKARRLARALDLRHRRVPSGQAAGGHPGRHPQGALRGGDQEELGGVHRAGRAARSPNPPDSSAKR